MIYPWQTQTWAHIRANEHRLPNAWLFYGTQGIGKSAFARHTAAWLLCENRHAQQEACGTCTGCQLFQAGNHPDFKPISADSAAQNDKSNDTSTKVASKLQMIDVDQVREVLDFAHLSSHRGGLRVVLIEPAEALGQSAANALLKVLEEPPANVLFILVCNQHDALLPTIRSRCRPVLMPTPTHEEASVAAKAAGVSQVDEFLAFHRGAPLVQKPELEPLRHAFIKAVSSPTILAVLGFAKTFDTANLADKKQSVPLAIFIDWMQKWLFDISLVKNGHNAQYYPAHLQALKQQSSKVDVHKLFALISRLNQLAVFGHHTLKKQAQVEDILIDYLYLGTKNAIKR